MKQIGILDALKPEARRALISDGRRRLYQKGVTIYMRGDVGDSVFLIETGRVEIALRTSSGRKAVLNHLGPGDLVGDIAVLDRGTRTADVVAASHVTGVTIGEPAIKAALLRDPETLYALLLEVCRKMRLTIESFEDLSAKEANLRLARCILRIAKTWGQGTPPEPVTIPSEFSQGDLGDLAGLARENVNRHLRKWVGEGIVEIGEAGLVIRNHQALVALSEGG